MRVRISAISAIALALALLSLGVFAEAGQKNRYIEASGALEDKIFVVSVPAELALLTAEAGGGAASMSAPARSNKPVGRVDAVKVEPGAIVKRDEVLFSIAGELAVANLDRAQAQYEQIVATIESLEGTRGDLAKGMDKIKEGSSTVNKKVRVLKKRRDQAEVGLSLAGKLKDASEIKAGASGRVRELKASEGMVAYPGQRLMLIANEQTLRLDVYLPVDEAVLVEAGDDVEVSVDARPRHVFKGKVAGVGGKAIFAPSNSASGELELIRVMRVLIDVVNEDGILKSGMPSDARIAVAK
ncbi:MAG: efflux RND transporter periplasmic adaptor subunit [Candidatus Aquicultor sp.]|nr:efflux RND transporter periplasmic adaptor subunit [Candidatus Aquicultor sp.]